MRRPSSGAQALQLLVTGALLSLAGCASVLQTMQDMADLRPSADVTAVRFADLDLRSVTLEFDIEIGNPYSFDLPLLDLDFGLSTSGQPFLDGSSRVGGSVPSRGNKTVSMPLRIDLVGLVETVRSIRPGQVVPYDAELGLGVDVQGMGPMRLPLRKSGELPVPNAPDVSVSSFQWQNLSLSEVRGDLALDIGNTNEFPFSLRSVDYDLSLANTSVAQGQNREQLQLDAGGSGELIIPLAFSPASAGLALINMLGGGEADYALLGGLAIDTPFGPLEIPFESRGSAPSSD